MLISKYFQYYRHDNIRNDRHDNRNYYAHFSFDVEIRIGQLNDSMLIATKLGSVTRKLFASPTYLARHGKPNTVDQLVDHQLLIMNPLNNDLKLNLVSAEGENFTLNCKPRLLVDDFAILKQSIVDGLGIAVLPSYMSKEEVAAGQLVHILPDWGMETVDVYALYPRHRAKIPKVRAFLDFVVDIYGDALS